MSTSRARPRAQPLRQQQQPVLYRSDSSPQLTVSGTCPITSSSVRFKEDTSRDRCSSKSAAARVEQRSMVLQTAGGRRVENTPLVSLRGSREKRVNFMETEKELATASSSPLSLAHELAKTQRELERLRMQLRSSNEHEQKTEEYVSGLEATVAAQRHDNLLLRHHLANRQLLAEVLEEENRDLVETQQQMHLQQHPIACPQSLITHASTGTMTVVSPANAFGDGNAQPSSFSAFCAQLPDRQSNFAGPSPPLSPTQSMPTSYHHVYGAAGGPHMHELPLHSPTVTALHDRWAQTQIAHEALPHGYADQQEALQRRPSLQQQGNNGANSTPIPIRGTTDNRFASPPQHISVSEETLFSSSTTSSSLHNTCAITHTLGTPQQVAATQHQLQSLGIRSRETEHAIANALDTPNCIHQNALRGYPHSDASLSATSEAAPLLEPRRGEELFTDQQRCGHVALKALQDQVAEQEAEIAELRRQVAERQAEIAELRQLLAEAQREAQAAGARQRDSSATVQALRDQMAEQEAEMIALRQLLGKAQREAPVDVARPLESGAAVQALRDQMAEQEAEVAELRQLLAEAQREAQAAGARQRDSGATVQALRDQMAEQEAEVTALRQLLGKAQREAPVDVARPLESGATVQALRDQMAEQEAEVAELRQLLAEAQREAQAAGARQRDSGATVQALRDQMAEQEAEMIALRQLLGKAQREAPVDVARPLESGAAVQALRDQMAEQEAEVAELRQLLAEAQREAQAAGARQRDSGATVQALRDQMAEQEAEVAELRQLLAEAQREAQAAGARQRDSGATVQALRDQMAEQEAEMIALRQLLGKAQREAPVDVARPLESGAAVQALRDQMAEQEAEVAELRQLLGKAQREAQAAGARQRDSGATVQALRDQMAEQEAEMIALRQLLGKAQREAPVDVARPLESGAAVQALRDQMAEQEAEVAELRQLLAEAQREAQAAGARQRDSGATVQALRDQMAEQEAEVAELRQLLGKAQREAPVDVARPLESGATVQALRDQMAEQEAEVAELRQLLGKAQREAPVDVARPLESGATVQALRDQMAEQEAEVAELRQLLGKAQREAPVDVARPLESGAAVQALRDQMAEQEAEVAELRQLLAEAQREAQAAGARQRDSGATVQALRDQMAEQEAEVAELRQLLAEAQREAQAAGARQRDSGATVQALRDQMAEQEAEMIALRQLLGKAQREAPVDVARPLESGAAVQALRDQMAEQEAEVAELRQLLAEAQREAQAAGARQRDSGATVQALRDQMAEQEAEVAELRQLLGKAQREAPVDVARPLESGATVQALRDQMAEQEAEVAELRQLLAEAQREAQAAGARQRDGVSVIASVGQEEGVRLAAGCVVAGKVDGGAGRGVLTDSVCEGSEGKGDSSGWCRDRGLVEVGAADYERGLASTGDNGERKLVAGAVDRGRSVSDTEELRSALAGCREKLTALEVELMAAKEAVEELRWYDERRDNCVEGRPLRQTYVRRSMEGVEWALVASACEEELIWRLRVDCSRACHVNVDCVRRVEYVLGSLHAEFCVEHNVDVEGSELKDRVAEYPFPATWALFRRIVEGRTVSGPMQWSVPSRAEEKLLAEEALARIFAQLEEACARQAFTSDWSEQRTELLHAAKLALAEVVAASRRECTDSLERLEELAALLLEARESERELRDRLFAAEEDMYEVRRQHDDDLDGLVGAEAEARRSLDLYAARVAAQDEAMRVQVEQIVDLQEEVQALASALSDKNADLTNAHAQAAALSRQVDETAAAYADTLEKLEKSVEMLDASRTNELVLSQTLYEAEYRCTQLRNAIEMDAAAHRAELVSATAERDRFKEGMEVFREVLPSLLAAAQPQPRKDNGDAGAGVEERISTSALDAAFSEEGYAVAQGLREVLLRHLGCVEQLRRDKEGLADELDEAEKARGGYMAVLEDALRSLVEERELRMRAHESQLQFSEQMMRELTMMRNAEEDEMVDDKADMEVNSNYGLLSTCSSSSPAVQTSV
ncbi:conserved hypothetical protein [Leishmania major strain Friedlin]|uniref:Flagellar attachment zone protein 1 conserved domain-containing protein n=1 Tax=Leishmania major TaxID=5664 RepID=Q4QBL4_LEIMA|nr:conserved hypothetical protein [Leishmania major strain Friedlin]CAJ04672.1 conserved hypothetical protein [Leishmania major strain Friedlin]|eukprot:XP_001683284.1 conserved hypothetical protein [Leishmania major strain Friedlin]